jgi:xanthine dehydrogenase accessory factor
MYQTRQDIRRFLSSSVNVAAISVLDAKGSAPRDAGAWMLVSPHAIFRTIGGGNLEHMAIEQARNLLAGNREEDILSIPLGPEIGQCCGGHIRLRVERLGPDDQAEYTARVDRELAELPHVFVFGAGHVGARLAEALSLLPVRPVLIDTRIEELQHAPDGIETCLTALPESVVRTAPAESAFVVLTHDHSLDFLIVREALKRKDARYVGMIGSRTKRATFSRWFENETGSRHAVKRLVCPIGKQVSGDKRPEVIASFVAAEIIAHLTIDETTNIEAHMPAHVGEDA